jgi:hypothetical protein
LLLDARGFLGWLQSKLREVYPGATCCGVMLAADAAGCLARTLAKENAGVSVKSAGAWLGPSGAEVVVGVGQVGVGRAT